jgi:hypothetical protein
MTEFAYSACNKPYNKGEIDQHELVLHKAVRFVTTRQRNRPTVGDILQHLDWGSFEDRCKHARVVIMYRIAKGKSGYYKNILISHNRQSKVHAFLVCHYLSPCKTQQSQK